jgi:hypothetical protein
MIKLLIKVHDEVIVVLYRFYRSETLR